MRYVLELTGLFFAAVVVLFGLMAAGIVNFLRPVWVQNDPLNNSVQVIEVGDDYFVVEDGRRFVAESDSYFRSRSLDEIMQVSNYRVDLVEKREPGHGPRGADEWVQPYVGKPLCGNGPWTRARFQIQIIPVQVDTLYRDFLRIPFTEVTEPDLASNAGVER